MSQNRYSIPWGPLASLVLLAVLPFLLAEFIAESRITPYWTGLHFNEWLGMLWTGLAYYATALLVTMVIHAALSTQPQTDEDSERIRKGRLTLFHLLATLATSTLIYYFLQGDVLPKLQGDLDLAHRTSLVIVAIVWALQRFDAFAFAPTVIGSLGAVVGSALLMQVYSLTLAVRTFGFETALDSTLQFLAIIFGLSVAASVVGSRKPSWGTRAGVALCWIAIAYPVYKQTDADHKSSQREIVGPNVLMITADTMRADYLSVYGGDVETPVLEGLAAKGAKFQKAISLAPWTVPAFDGMFSSKFPPSVDPNLPLKVRDKQLTLYGQIGSYWLGQDKKSIVRRMRDKGYDANAIIGNFAMRKESWLLDDFNTYYVLLPLLETYHGPFQRSPFLSTALRGLSPSLYLARPFDNTRAVTEYAMSLLRYRDSERFFFWVHYFDPHTPYDPPPEYRTRSGPFEFLGIRSKAGELSEHDYVRSLYSGEIRYVDHEVGRVLETLKETGLEENTYVIFASDHGEEFWDHGAFGHGHSVYNELLHVPLIMTGPGIPVQTVSKPVSMIDFAPTLAEWVDVPADAEWRGKSWASSLRAEKFDMKIEPIFSQATGRLPPPPEPLQSVIFRSTKMIYGMESGTYRMFDLFKDPGEKVNIVSSRKGMSTQLREDLDDWSASFPVTFGAFANQGKVLEPDLETLENLKTLGYLPADTPEDTP